MPPRLVKPNIPPDSCDHIDRVIELADNLISEEDSEIRTGYSKIIEEDLELIRVIITQLREASKFWHDKYIRKG